MGQTSRHKVDLLVGNSAADFNQIDTAFNEFDTSAALDADLTAHAHGSTGDHGAPVSRAANLVVTGGATVQTGGLNVIAGGLIVGAGGAAITGNSTVTGTLTVSGGVSGTLLTAAQPNITSLGTLASLAVSGTISGTLSTAAQPNITSVGSLVSLITGGISVGNAGIATTSHISAGPSLSGAAGDISANRNNGAGYVWMGDGSHYVGFDGANYQMPNAPLYVASSLAVTAGNGAVITNGPLSSDWFRNTTAGQGLYNVVTAVGISLPVAGPSLYPSGDLLVGQTLPQTLSNKTLSAPYVSSPTLVGTVQGAPSWAAGQTFPSLFVTGTITTTGTFTGTSGLIVSGATPATGTGQVAIGGQTGIGAGANSGIVAPVFGSGGSGPSNPQVIARWVQSSAGGTTYWIPMAQ